MRADPPPFWPAFGRYAAASVLGWAAIVAAMKATGTTGSDWYDRAPALSGFAMSWLFLRRVGEKKRG
jgi:hypothetical protein